LTERLHKRLFRSQNAGNLESLPQNIWQDILAEMSQVLTVGSESRAAGFAAGDNDTRTAQRHCRLSLDVCVPDVPLKFGLCFCEDFGFVHIDDSPKGRTPNRDKANPLVAPR
jgi:hypothetical protein